ncbi:MAG: hypothetical protein A3J58_02760 [Candidatus Sungbacteria bacterium RIFCSPHIGHO2_02_FULL_52_23]|uniref:Toxin HicA n=1 Tax=Candidatus Sungbacteria bacterium RIFCSPHIGHO2_02_FULL_52_23 TaxID=1802274 RepID=A0A1G2KXA7_9BACT|nr:MAG: hypothetical protein A3J58_02760 [Candidatus Sungbacteria bacterium RIFCSPHIGHO2_02_FULL_52_23]
MPRLKTLSGGDVIKILGTFGFTVIQQKGSHVKLERIQGGERAVLTVPNHTELVRGTVRAIFMQASRYIPEADLRRHFYTK